jgi:hypothetical protein
VSLVVPDDGETWLLRLLLQDATYVATPFHLHLYVNDYSPDRESVLDDFEEADFDNYYVAELARSEWQTPVSVDGVAVSLYGTGYIQWTTDGIDYSIVGYYVTDASDSVVLWAERWPVVFVLSVTGPLLFQPLMRLHSEVEPEPPAPP